MLVVMELKSIITIVTTTTSVSNWDATKRADWKNWMERIEFWLTFSEDQCCACFVRRGEPMT